MTNNKIHQPAMLNEVMQYLQVKDGDWYLDATFGRGGHTEAILNNKGKVLALDCDQEAITYGQKIYQKAISLKKLILVKSNFINLEQVAKANHLSRFSGILFDFGASSDQLLAPNRGFSFQTDSFLDMRMDQELGVTAHDLLAVLSLKQLTNIFKTYGGEAQAYQIAKEIKKQPTAPKTTSELSTLITRLKNSRSSKLHPATKVFQALRIAVNTELENIQLALPGAFLLLNPGGRLLTLSFHEGEDRIVKNYFKSLSKSGLGKLLTEKPIKPSALELKNNIRARSSRLRALEKK